MKKKIEAISFFIFFCVFMAIFEPSGTATAKEATMTPSTTSEEAKAGFNPGSWLISLYKNHISTVDGDRCPSEPSCSTYSQTAIQKHGFFIGWMMTVDRLIHEFSVNEETSPMVFTEGKWKIYDPVENNDFWWFPRDGKSYD